jgi:hypothetical protein
MENEISSAKKENMTWMAMTMVKMRELGAHSAWLLVPWKTLITSPDWSSPRVLAEPGEVFSFFFWFRLRENVHGPILQFSAAFSSFCWCPFSSSQVIVVPFCSLSSPMVRLQSRVYLKLRATRACSLCNDTCFFGKRIGD